MAFSLNNGKNLEANKSASFSWKYCWRKHKYLLIINACVLLAESFFYFSNNGQPYAWHGYVATTFVLHLASRRMESFLSVLSTSLRAMCLIASDNCVNFFDYMKPLASEEYRKHTTNDYIQSEFGSETSRTPHFSLFSPDCKFGKFSLISRDVSKYFCKCQPDTGMI